MAKAAGKSDAKVRSIMAQVIARVEEACNELKQEDDRFNEARIERHRVGQSPNFGAHLRGAGIELWNDDGRELFKLGINHEGCRTRAFLTR
jgi:hypothetical protein